MFSKTLRLSLALFALMGLSLNVNAMLKTQDPTVAQVEELAHVLRDEIRKGNISEQDLVVALSQEDSEALEGVQQWLQDTFCSTARCGLNDWGTSLGSVFTNKWTYITVATLLAANWLDSKAAEKTGFSVKGALHYGARNTIGKVWTPGWCKKDKTPCCNDADGCTKHPDHKPKSE